VPLRIEMTARAARDLRGLPEILKRHAAAVVERLAADDPSLNRKKLQGRPETRVRLGALRILYTQEGGTITIRHFADRRDAYR
jgi:mRNA-degrading endonuclease RelE of RelBE toxin-antitoxin system